MSGVEGVEVRAESGTEVRVEALVSCEDARGFGDAVLVSLVERRRRRIGGEDVADADVDAALSAWSGAGGERTPW